MRRKRTLTIAAILFGCVASTGVAWRTIESPSAKYSKSNVTRLLFLGRDRVVLANHLGEVYASDSAGRTWSRVSSDASGSNLTVANTSEVWGCYGWPGVHEGPSAKIWQSFDEGRKWTSTELKLPPGTGGDPEVERRLPGSFINEPKDAPLLLMRNLQLVRPRPNTDFDKWTLVGKPVPTSAQGSGWHIAGVQHSGTIYVAIRDRIFMSRDVGEAWLQREVHPFFSPQLVCQRETCYALLTGLGSDWNGLVATAAGRNDWEPFGTLELAAVREALSEQARTFGAVETFGATALLPGDGTVLVSGIVNAGKSSWGAVLVLSATGPPKSLSGAVPNGLWELARDPRGRLWAAGIGVFVHNDRQWTPIWSSASPSGMR